MSYLLYELWPYLLGLVGIIAGVLTAFAKGKSSERSKQAVRTAKAVKQVKKERENVEAMDDDAMYDEFDRLHNNKR